MNTPARYTLTAAALGALLLFSGCFTTRDVRTEPGREVSQFAVVDKSKDLEVTPQLLAELRTSVAKYLKEEGYTRAGEYTVKVNFTPDLPEGTGKWVVVRLGNVPARTFTLLAAYPGADVYYPYDYRGFYNYGSPAFARFGYYDPYDYYYGGYFPPAGLPSNNYRPVDRNNHPPGTPNRWDGHNPNPDRRPDNNHPRTDNPRSDSRDHPRDSSPPPETASRNNGGASSSPPPATQSTSAPQPREDRASVRTEEN